MDILLIDPPQLSLKRVLTDRGYNLGLTSLAAYLRTNGVDSAIVTADLLIEPPKRNLWKDPLALVVPDGLRISAAEMATRHQDIARIVNEPDQVIWKKLSQVVTDAKPKVVGISHLTPMSGIVKKVANIVKQVNPEIRVVVGSYHPTFCAEQVLRNPDIDFAVVGEGEIPFLKLIKEIQADSPKWESVPSLCYRDKEGTIRRTPPAGRLDNLDDLPFPARDLVMFSNYDFYRVHSVITARGCPYRCSFCSDQYFYPGKMRRRSLENVLKELVHLKETYPQMDYVDFVDGTFTYDRKYLEDLCQALIDRKLNISWRCTARYDTIDREMLKLMKKSGCTALYIGLESGSDEVLKELKKNMSVSSIVEASKIVRDAGIISVTSMLLGSPNESRASLEDTLKVMRGFNTDFFDVHSFIPLAGTEFYNSLSQEASDAIDWNRIGYKSWETNFTNSLSLEELNTYRRQAYAISDRLRKKSIARIGSRLLLRSLTKKLK
jgi:anaerobic magnesium-protoporphyrin IX monomethyl ester cyclase